MKDIYLSNISEGKRLHSKKTVASQMNDNSSQAPSFKEVLRSVAENRTKAGEIRQDLVHKFKQTLADGTYEVKGRELAEKMVQKIRENRTRTII